MNSLQVDAQGRFDVLLSPSRPEGYQGDWWPLVPTANKLLLRMVRADWTSKLYETIDWYNNHSSLNDTQARPDSDGVLRIVVSAKDPGVPNWLDTAGHPRGVVQGRWMGCDSQPIPAVKKVALADVRKRLPRETPVVTAAQREAIVRERRAALQQRPHLRRTHDF